MKTINFLIRSLILLLAIYISFSIINCYNMPYIYCEGVQSSTLDNKYWKIEEIRTNIWHILFHNVGIKYEVAQCKEDTDTITSLFEFREIGPDYAGVFNPDFLWKMTQEDVIKCWAANNQAYEKLEDGSIRLTGSTDSKLVFTRTYHNNIVDAAMEHFNSIQCGEYHPDIKNKINPNSHGRGADILSNVKNTFGIHNSDSWPVNNVSSESSELKGTKIKKDIRSPLDQFIIRELFTIIAPLLANLYISYTNMGLYLTIATIIVITISLLATNYEKIRTSYWFLSLESIYATLYSIVINQINAIKGQNYYPFIYCLFVFILTNNLLGMIPYSFSPTSHFVLTFFISFTIVFGSTILGFILHKLKFFSLLVPNGCPLGLLPLLVLIESISYLARNVSLGLRLAANILSGHMLLNILSDFTYKIMNTNFIYFFVGIIPLIFIGAFSTLELGIAFIQSQVFVVLSSSYTKDSIELH